MAALSELQIAANADELRFVLDNQTDDGAWPTFAGGLAEHASTYATAWVIIGLDSQLKKRLIADADTLTEISVALDNAANWLIGQRLDNLRWHPYPNNEALGEPSDAISGAVVHALNRVSPDTTRAFAGVWLGNLPWHPIPADLEESNSIELRMENTTHIDRFVQLPMPWMVIATLDLFPYGSVGQKAHALAWLEATLNHETVAMADTETGAWNNWRRAELQVALKRVLAETR